MADASISVGNPAFVAPFCLPSSGSIEQVPRVRQTLLSKRRLCPPRRPSRVTMQLPPDHETREVPPLDEDQRGPEDYDWDPNFPGTLRPGRALDDCFPLEEVMNSGVYERMVYQELDMYAICDEIHKPDEDMLEFLAKEGRLLGDDGDLEMEAERQVVGVTEEDLDFSDEDDKMLAYYSKQGEGSSVGASSDFGGIAESSIDVGGI